MSQTLKLQNAKGRIFIPDALAEQPAIARTTHLGVGAHQDDLEFMAMHGILECFQRNDRWFGAVTCTDGAGSSRTGDYADFTDAQMQEIRYQEQCTAGIIGQYAFVAQLGYPSSTVKQVEPADLIGDLAALLKASRPDVVYTHNPADKHASHIGVFAALIKALRSLPKDERPKKLIGCEVWRDLDWLCDNRKVLMDVSAHQNLAAAMNGVFDSQIAGGKRYDLAVAGRRCANATFFESHAIDNTQQLCFGIDLTPLLTDDSLCPAAFTAEAIAAFARSVEAPLKHHFSKA